MSKRHITSEGLRVIWKIERFLEASLSFDDWAERDHYETMIDYLVILTRPHLLEAWERQQEPAIFPDAPPDAASPASSSEAGGGSLISEEALIEALQAMQALFETGAYRGDPGMSLPSNITAFVMRHCAQQTESRKNGGSA